MSELPAGDTHDVIRQSGQVVAVVVLVEPRPASRTAVIPEPKTRPHKRLARPRPPKSAST